MNVKSVQVSLYLFQVSLVTWVRVASPCIFFGLYYGLLSTLPIGPSHILTIRSFLLKGNISGIVSLSGLMIGQLILFFSIFCSPLYILLVKPHFITLLIVPYMLFYWYRTKDFWDYQIFRPIGSLIDPQIYIIFLDSFALQLLNPILLPSPVLTRLIHLSLFRYSSNVMFLVSAFTGWLMGHLLFMNLSKFLLVRIESDSPILYLLVKRIIQKTFSIIIYINILLYLGKAPVSLFTHKIEDRIVLLDENLYELPDWTLWMFKEWPSSSFDQYKENRPTRYIRNSRFSGNGPVKTQVSNHFFNRCLTDGKERIAFTALPSLSIFSNQLQLLTSSSKDEDFDCSLSNPYKDWIYKHSRRNEALLNELKNRVQSLDTKSIFSKTIERRTELSNPNEERLPRLCNPFLSTTYRVRIPISKSSWILYDLLKPKIDTNNEDTKKSNYYPRIENWISNKHQQLDYEKIPFPWETLSPRAQRIFLLMFENSVNFSIQKIFDKVNLDYKGNDLLSVTPELNWEHVFQLPLPERILFFIYLKEDCNGFDWIDLLDIISIDKRRSSLWEQRVRSLYKVEELLEELPHNTNLLFNNRFDIVGGITDIRNRKLKNLGVSIGKTRAKTRKIIKRFSETPDFRRRLIKGSMRSRRRKMLVWKLFQERAHSPFFLRLMEMPQHSTKEFIGSKGLTIDSEQETNTEFEEQKSISSSLKNVQALRSLLSARLDVSSIHTGRGLLLVLQSNIRKYVKLPILITVKNIVRILLFQAPEWNQDWSEWHKESHINCTYDGEEFSDTDLPGRWLKEGLQIKIVHPFQLKPWHKYQKKQSILRRNKINRKSIKTQEARETNKGEQEKFKATYLTIWGFQTDRPFGTIQKQPSFWKSIKKALIKTYRNSLSLRIRQIDSLWYRLGIPKIFDSSVQRYLNLFNRFRVAEENSSQTNAFWNNTLSDAKIRYEEKERRPDSEKTHKESTNIASYSQSRVINDNRDNLDDFNGVEPNTGFFIHQSTNILTKTIDKKEQSIKIFPLSKREIDQRLNKRNLISSLRFKKRLVDIQRRKLRLRRGITEFIEKYLSMEILIQRTSRVLYHYFVTLKTFQIQLLRVIKNTIENDVDIEELTLATLNINNKIVEVDNRLIGPLSQAYIYDNVWYKNGTDNVDLNRLMETLKDSETPKELSNQKEIDRSYDSNDYNERWNREKYNNVFNNADLSIKRMKSSSSPHARDKKTKSQDFLDCLENIDETIQEYINEPIKDFVVTQGLVKQLSNLTRDDWEIWLGFLNRYNLPLEVWRKITPQAWRVNVENLNTFEKIEKTSFEDQGRRRYVSHESQDDFCLYIQNPSLKDRIKNLTKRYKYTNLLFNLVNSLQKHGAEVLKKAIIQKSWWKSRIKGFIAKKKRKSFHQPIFQLQKELVLKTDLALWIIPDVSKLKDLSKTGSASNLVSTTCILEKSLSGYLPDEQGDYGIMVKSDEMLLKERLNHYYIFQWKWKSEAVYKKLQRFKDFLSLINILEVKQDFTTFSISMGVDLNLLNRFLEEDKIKILEDLFSVSSHRLSRVFDDQILMYKIVTILLKFRNRFRRSLNKNILDECKIRLLLINRRIDLPYLYNIDDLLFPRKRRESQFLSSLGIAKRVKWTEDLVDSTFQVQKTTKGEESKDFSKTQIIKRFLWPSHRLEELACINRFYLNTNNGSRFAIIKIRMYTVI
uniref:Protein TIC 214 n=1 Tax=Trichomanes trollii TaxID=1481379 RepID=A0A410YEK7_9MONI|nr:conserved hypothetical protein Ycf1 [Trichomanes trollii]QAV57629.1 conserved hypothetical protein Ycf1 [Trichomanes trollii]